MGIRLDWLDRAIKNIHEGQASGLAWNCCGLRVRLRRWSSCCTNRKIFWSRQKRNLPSYRRKILPQSSTLKLKAYESPEPRLTTRHFAAFSYFHLYFCILFLLKISIGCSNQNLQCLVHGVIIFIFMNEILLAFSQFIFLCFAIFLLLLNTSNLMKNE